MTCALCGKDEKLLESHIIPKFVFNWIKDTSSTGYLRQVNNVNKRMQDGLKLNLLCYNCEQFFSSFEKKFAEKIFQPYTKAIENNFENYTFHSVEHEDWLLKFVISLQWRGLKYFRSLDNLNFTKKDEFEKYEKIWHEYLIGSRDDTGKSRSYIIFLSSFDNAEGYWGKPFPPNINFYLVRATDCTPVVGDTTLAMYTKIGPIALFTTIHPRRFKGLESALISKNGILKTAQENKNATVVNFLYHTRPQELLNRAQAMSERQKEKISRSYLENPERVKNSLTQKMQILDTFMKKFSSR